MCLVAGSARATDPRRRSLGKISASAVPEQHAKKVHLEAVIDASPDRVWGIVTDRANLKRTMPRSAASTELSRDVDVVVCQSTLELTWPLPDLVATTRAVHTAVAGHWRSEWTLVSGDYNVNQGSWDLTPFAGDPNRTLVVYDVLVAPKIPVPAALAQVGQTHAPPSMIRGLRSQLGVPR